MGRQEAIPDDPRRVFEGTNIEGDEEALFEERIEMAADGHSREIDGETIGLFQKYGVPLPDRLQRLQDLLDDNAKYTRQSRLRKTACNLQAP